MKPDLNKADRLIRETSEVYLHAVKKQSDGEYVSRDITCSDDLKQQLKNIASNAISFSKDKQLNAYNILGSNDDTIEYCRNDEAYYRQMKKIINSFTKLNVDISDTNEYNFFVYQFKNQYENVYAFRQRINFKRFKTGFLGYMEKEKFHHLDAKTMLGTDDQVDLIVTSDNVIIFNHISFERILNLKDGLIDEAKNVLDKNDRDLKEGITNYQNFKRDAFNNKNIIRRIAKVPRETSMLFLKEPGKLKEIVKNFGLDLEFNKENKLIYDNKTQLNEIVNFMQDAYYKTLIGEKNGIDERRSDE